METPGEHFAKSEPSTILRFPALNIWAYLGQRLKKYLSAVSEYPNTLFQTLACGVGIHDSLPSVALVLRTLSSKGHHAFRPSRHPEKFQEISVSL